MKKQTFRLGLALTVSAALFFTSCRKSDAVSTPEQTPVQALAPQELEDHTTMTPERTAIVEAFERTPRTEAITIYRGFKINYVGNVAATVKTRMNSQIDFIYTSGVKAATITKMQGTTINCGVIAGVQANLFYSGGQVYITDLNAFMYYTGLGGPVIFHECMHYIHDRHTPSGFNNATVNNYYVSAYNRVAYPRTEYVLRNRVEYLATTSEAWFNPGQTFRVPFNRAYVTPRDGQFGNWLSTSY
jgi:hypothetical protein